MYREKFDSNRIERNVMYRDEFDKWASQSKKNLLKVVYTTAGEEQEGSAIPTNWNEDRDRIDKTTLETFDQE